jgi:hypothetical protein
MLRGLFFSSILHIFLLILFFYIIPYFFNKSNPNFEIAIDIITSKELPSFNDPKLIPKLVVKPKKIKLPEPQLDNKVFEAEPVIVKEQVKKLAKKPEKPRKKQLEIKQDTLKESSEVSDSSIVDNQAGEGEEFAEILEEIKRVQKQERQENLRKKYIYGKKLNYAEKKNIKDQVNSCWLNIANKLFRKEEIAGIKVKIMVSLDKSGNILQARLANSAKSYMGLNNDLYRQVADSALSVFYRCKKITGLPRDKYEEWKEFEFVFDPNIMR